MRHIEIKIDFRKIHKYNPEIERVPKLTCQSKISPLCHDTFIPTFREQTSCLHCINYWARNKKLF